MSVARLCRRCRAAACGWLIFLPVFAFAATDPSSLAPVAPDQVIVPNSTVASHSPVSTRGTGTGALTMVGVAALAGTGGWLLWRSRIKGMNQFSRAPRNLSVEETRALGNRQYLVVASYQDKKFLIGVCPGRIDLLSALDNASTGAAEKTRA
jgi:flagellar protein FliO/FliZ